MCPSSFTSPVSRAPRALRLAALGFVLAATPVAHAFDGARPETLREAPLVSPQEVGEHVAAAFDRFGTLHLAVFELHQRQIVYYRRAGSFWSAPSVVDRGNGVEGPVALAVDAFGRPHLTYRNTARDQVRYAFFNGSAWRTCAVDAGGVGPRTSVAVDADGRPHVVYDRRGALRYARADRMGWRIEAVDAGYNGAVALDRQGHPHVVYALWDRVRHAVRENGRWECRTVLTAPAAVHDLHVVLDGKDRPWVATLDRDSGVRCSWPDGDRWRTEIVREGAGSVSDVSLAVDDRGRPRVLFDVEGREGGVLYQAERDGENWNIRQAGESSLIFAHALALDAAGRAAVVYLDMAGARYALRAVLPPPAALRTAQAAATSPPALQ